LFDVLESENVHQAGVRLPNPLTCRLANGSVYRRVGVFHSLGRKFDKFWDVAWFERPLRLNGSDTTAVG
jgi:phosphinothricin acetyltransferase